RQRSGCRLHAVGGIDVAFNKNRNSVQRSAHALLSSFLIERVGNGEGVGINLDNTGERRHWRNRRPRLGRPGGWQSSGHTTENASLEKMSTSRGNTVLVQFRLSLTK